MRAAISVLLGISISIAANAANPQACLTSDSRQKEILDQFSFESVDPQFKVDFCDSKNFGYRVAKAILSMKSAGKPSHSKQERSNQGILANDPFGFFSSRINTLRFEPNGGACVGATTAYVSTAGAHDGIMHICRALADTDELIISSEFIHEARHQDGFPHVVCDHGYYTGDKVGRCDKSYADGGSHGAQTEYFVEVSRSSQADPSVRQEARAQAIQHLVERFNELPLGIKKGALLLNQDSKTAFYDGKSLTPLRSFANASSRIFQIEGVLHVYDSEKKTEAAINDGIHLGNVQKNYKPDLPDAQFVDFYTTSVANCWLYTKRLNCNFPHKRITLEIKDFTPIGFESQVPLIRSEAEIHVISREGGRYSVSANSTSFRSERTDYLNVGDWDSLHWIVLGFDGKVSLLNKQGGSDPAPGLRQSEIFTKMITPHYWSRALQDL